MSSNLAVAEKRKKGSVGFVMGFKNNTPIGNAGCDACRVYPGYGIAHVGRIRRPRRIRQWRGADAGCDACRVLSDLRERTCRADKAFTPHPPVAHDAVAGCNACRVLSGQEDCTCRADKAFTPHPPAVIVLLTEKIVIQHKQMRGTQEKFGALAARGERVVILLNWAIGS